ncbi:hypothetical protein [uncultured Imperialibacter sp.]|uniref:hypothetical protein n=1 Tax=uncultured Imperialibacter sp. TaxID=1672639 RepID=UPI0030DC6A8F|tara:strand:- start:27213 stop:27689 length:477 start_codon:yes stop_codon:yes gene_type:complete
MKRAFIFVLVAKCSFCGQKEEEIPIPVKLWSFLNTKWVSLEEGSRYCGSHSLISNWHNFGVTFTGDNTGGRYVTTGVPDTSIYKDSQMVWKESGLWKIRQESIRDSLFVIDRDDSVSVGVEMDRDGFLNLSFAEKVTDEGGRLGTSVCLYQFKMTVTD